MSASVVAATVTGLVSTLSAVPGGSANLPNATDMARQLDDLRASVVHYKVAPLGVLRAALSVRSVLGEVANLKGIFSELNPFQLLWAELASLAAPVIAVGGIIAGIALAVL